MSEKPSVLIAEDDADLRQSLHEYLSMYFDVHTAEDGVQAVEAARKLRPTVIVLDLMMPKMDGIQACEVLRKDESTKLIPILILTSASDKPQKLEAFRQGADDYVTKPFDSEELLERIRSKIRVAHALPKTNDASVIKCGNLTLKLDSMETWVGEREVQLTVLEFNLVKFLVNQRGKLCSRQEILEAVWNNTEISGRILDPHILTIRKKLTGFDHKIASIYGGGYILKPLSTVA